MVKMYFIIRFNDYFTSLSIYFDFRVHIDPTIPKNIKISQQRLFSIGATHGSRSARVQGHYIYPNPKYVILLNDLADHHLGTTWQEFQI